MIPVSQEFKTAIKSKERYLKGYVEIINNDAAFNFNASAETTYPQTYTSVDGIVDRQPVKEKYGTLDVLPLDGSYLTMDNNLNDKAPFIVELSNKTIDVSFTTVTTKTITFVFDDLKPIYTISQGEPNIYDIFKMTIQCYNGSSLLTTKQTTFTSGEINVDLGSEITINKIVISFEFTQQAISDQNFYFLRINQVVIGDFKLLKDRDLVEFDIDEEVSKLVEEIPTNTTSIKIPRPTQETYLTTTFLSNMNEKSLIIPYIGAVIEDGTTEYVKMGEFYFNNIKHNKDKTTTLFGNNIIELLKNESLKDYNETNILSPSSISKALLLSFLANYQYSFATIDWESNINTWALRDNELIRFLSQIAFSQWDILYADRESYFRIRHIDNTIKDTLTKNELLDDVIPTQISKINTLELIRNHQSQEETGESKEIFRGDYVLHERYEYILIESPTGNLLNASFSIDGAGDIAVLTKGYYLAFAIIDGTVGSTITVVANSTKTTNETKTPYIMSNRGVSEKEVKLTFDSFTNQLPQYYIARSPILDMTPSYELELEYNGDPSIEAGDYINIETEDGTIKPIFIEKNYFKFDGGLSGRIKGVE